MITSIILCAGQSRRMKSATSKMLHSICGRPLCHYPVSASKFGRQVVVVGHQAQQVSNSLSEMDGELIFANQTEQLGTAHAVKVALEKLPNFSGTILILCGDTPLIQEDTLKRLCELRESSQAAVAMLVTTTNDPSGYGRIVRTAPGSIARVVEENEATAAQKAIREINPAIYAVEAAFLRQTIAKIEPTNQKKEYYLTDMVELAASQNGVVDMPVDANDVVGINDRKQLAEATRQMQQRIVERWMSEGVTFIDPDNTYIDDQVELEGDVTLSPGVMLLGKTVVKKGAQILPYSICEDAFVGPDCVVGPFARLRAGTILEEAVKVGNFVETKKSRFKKGSKANHLAYVGDAEVGEKTNVGAGTITCNYDGYAKHPTKLGDGVFVGSNTTLVAPVSIKDGAYIAAGSTVTKDVPENALGIGRARQENKEGYAEKIRQRLKK